MSSLRIRTSKRDANPSASRSRIFGASSVSNSSRAVNGTAAATKSAARVYLDGSDVTPQSLLVSRIKPSTPHQSRPSKGKRATRSKQGVSVMGASVILSQDHFSTSSIEDSDSDAPPPVVPTASSNQQSSAGGSGSAPPVPKAPTVVPVASVAVTPAPDDDDAGGADADGGVEATAPKMIVDIGTSPSFAQSTLTTTAVAPKEEEKKIRRPVAIMLTETPTEMLFELRSLCVAQDASFHQAVMARNRQYVEMCAAKKGSDKFVEGRSQTLQLAQKTKEVMTAPPATRDSACMATNWDIFDCIRVKEDSSNDHEDTNAIDVAANGHDKRHIGDPAENAEVMLKQQVFDIVDATMVSPGCVLDVDGDIVDDLRARQRALRHARKHRPGHSNNSNSQKSRVFHHSSGVNANSSQDYSRSMANSSSSMASPAQSSGNVSFGASQDIGGGADSKDSNNNSVVNSQIGFSGGASQILSNGGSDSKQGQNAYARANTNVDMGEIIAQQRTAKVLASDSLLKTASVVERAVQQNVYHHQHVQYRNFPVLTRPTALLEPVRKEKRGNGDHSDWRSSLGLTSDSGLAASAMVPPISSFPSAALGGMGTSMSGRSAKATLEKLWSFRCGLTEGRTVTCLAWNSVNDDLLAVAYSRAEPRPACPSAVAAGGVGVSVGTVATPATAVTVAPDGLVLFWSLKNPEYPERIYNLDVGVTSIDFSRSQPYMLAVGFSNGVVAIYDTRKEHSPQPSANSIGTTKPPAAVGTTASRPPSAAGASDAASSSAPRRHVPVPDASSETSSGKHLDTVWQVKWISKGSDRGENVVSISSDGRVTEWSIKKGLGFTDLMTLKRVANPLLGSDARGDGGVISRQASGHCIDFPTHDPSVYYVGTEDGIIHKCSVSYNEQYLETYYGHTGPVYQILVSPFSPDLFLSCSADWNVKLWHQTEQKEAFNFRSVNLQHAVLGISWCPSDATIFGTVTEDGRIEVWDLQQSTLDPIIMHYPRKQESPSATRADSKRVITTTDETLNSGPAASGGSAPGVFSSLNGLASALADPATQTPETAKADPWEVPLECTKIAFAPSAPVIVVGDSSGDVTVYRVPALTDGSRPAEQLSVEEQVARLHRVLNPNNQNP